MSNQTHEEQTQVGREAAQDVAGGLGDLIAQTLNLGASMARIVAEATSGGKAVPPPRQATPINGIVHYSVVSVVNVISTVATSVNHATNNATTAATSPQSQVQTTPTQAATAQAANRPTVHQGASLRIPLSIENPRETLLENMQFMCTQIELREAGEAGETYSREWIRFEPQTLSVAPNDFEKLTVYIDVPEHAQTGAYRVAIGLVDNTPIAEIDFLVVAAESNQH